MNAQDLYSGNAAVLKTVVTDGRLLSGESGCAMRCSLIVANAVTSNNRRTSGLITAMTAAVVLALAAAGCGTRPQAGQSGPLRAILTASVSCHCAGRA